MARLRRSASTLIRSQRKRTSWDVGPETAGGGQPQTITASLGELAAVAVQLLVDNQTLVRTRGELMMLLETSSLQGNGFHGAFGIAKATTAAITAGAASVPTPLTEEEWDGWIYHRYFSLLSGGTIAVATAAQQADQVNATTAALRLEVDSKAMRKVEIFEGLYAAIEVVEFGTAQMTWSFNSRLLFKDMG